MTISKFSIEQNLVKELEARIITGQLKVGEYMPAERLLATQMEVSRPVIHNALIRLEENGLIQIVPRQGAKVLDYKRHGNLSIVNSLIDCYGRDINHHLRDSILNLLKGHCDLIISDIIKNDFNATLELPKETLSIAMELTEKEEKIDAFVELYLRFAESAVNPLFLMLLNSCKLSLRDIGVILVERDSAYHTLLRLWSSLLHQLKIKDAEKAYAVNQTIFELLIEIWL